MYNDLHKFDDAIAVADMRNTSDASELRQYYYQWLLDTGQEEKAGTLIFLM